MNSSFFAFLNELFFSLGRLYYDFREIVFSTCHPIFYSILFTILDECMDYLMKIQR